MKSQQVFEQALMKFNPESWRYRLMLAFADFKARNDGKTDPRQSFTTLLDIYQECSREEKYLLAQARVSSNMQEEVILFTVNQFYNVIQARMTQQPTNRTPSAL